MLLEYLNEPDDGGNATGWRVGEDGLVEQLSDRSETVEVTGETTGEQVPLEWRESFRLDAAAIESLRDAIRSALGQVDEDHFGADSHVSHPRRLTWRLDDDGKTREIIVDGFPAVKVPPLDELLQTLLRLRHRDEGPVSTRWTWTTDGDQHTRDFDGEPAENAKLAAALDLVMPAPGDAPAGTGDDGHEGAPLLEIQWLAGNSPGDLLTVYPDGARVLKESGSVTRLAALPDGSVTELKTQLELLAPD